MVIYRPKGFAEAVLAFVLRWSLKLLLKPVFSPRFSIGFQRRWLSIMSRVTLIPRSVEIESAQVGGVPGEWLHRRGSYVSGPSTMPAWARSIAASTSWCLYSRRVMHRISTTSSLGSTVAIGPIFGRIPHRTHSQAEVKNCWRNIQHVRTSR